MRVYPGIAFGIALILAIPAHGVEPWFDPPRSPRIANYVIQARLHPDTRTVEGQALLTWKNSTRRTVHRLCFHMYMNAFKNESTVFMRESRGMFRGRRIPPEEMEWGWIEIRGMRFPEGQSLTYHYAQDGTVLWVELPEGVRAGQTVQIQYEFTTRLPRIVARTGFAGSFFMVAQWFPKIAVLEERGWNCHPFHATSEFYADFGVYDVQIQVPPDYIVGATGEQVAHRTEGEWTIYQFHAEDVHDFAWTAAPFFREITDQWRHVRIRMLYPPGHRPVAERILDAVRYALEWMAQRIGEYPYPVLTIVEPPVAGMNAGGMEYPTLITTAYAFFLPEWLRVPELVAIHEFGHQYWYGMVANNEFEAAWLDEGINTFFENRIINDRFGPRAIFIPGWGLWGYHEDLAVQSMRAFGLDPADQPAWAFVSFGSYGTNTYTKTMLTLMTLARLFGAERVLHMFRSYFQAWRFRHPYPRDFYAHVQRHLGDAAVRFLRRALTTTQMLDYGVDRVKCTEDRVLAGVFGYGKNRRTRETAPRPGRWYCRVRVRRWGDFVWPVQIRITYANGISEQYLWPGRRRWWRWEKSNLPARVVRVEVDPQNRLALDFRQVNNTWVAHTSPGLEGAKRRWWGWLLHVLTSWITVG